MRIAERQLYWSPNGDRWYLVRDDAGHVFVRHETNIPAGGRKTQIEIADFLAAGCGPQQQELLRLIGDLVDELADA